MQPVDVIAALKRRWPIVAICFALALVVSLPAANSAPAAMPSVHSSQSTIMVTPDGAVPFGVVIALTGSEVPERVADRGEVPLDLAEITSSVTVDSDGESGIVTFTAVAADAATAATLADEFATATLAAVEDYQVGQQDRLSTDLGSVLADVRGELAAAEAKLAGSPNDVLLKARLDGLKDREKSLVKRVRGALAVVPGEDVTLLRAASEPVAEAASDGSAVVTPVRKIALFAMLGLAVGILAALAVERFDPRPHRRDDLEAVFRMRTLAAIPYPRGRGRTRETSDVPTRIRDPRTLAAFRTLRSALLVTRAYPLLKAAGDNPTDVAQPANRQRVVLVASVRDSNESTAVAAGLASALAESGTRVLAIDGDHLSGRLTSMLDLGPGPGFVDLLEHHAARPDAVAGAVQLSGGTPRLAALPAGVSSDYPGASPERVSAVLDAAREFADVVVIDGAPILDAVQSLDLLPVVDGVLLVAAPGDVLRDEAEQAAEILDNLGAKVYGLVLIEPFRRRAARGRPSPPPHPQQQSAREDDAEAESGPAVALRV